MRARCRQTETAETATTGRWKPYSTTWLRSYLFSQVSNEAPEPPKQLLLMGKILDSYRKDDASFARVWRAQLTQIAIPFLGLPGLTVSTGMVGKVPVGVQVGVTGSAHPLSPERLCTSAATPEKSLGGGGGGVVPNGLPLRHPWPVQVVLNGTVKGC